MAEFVKSVRTSQLPSGKGTVMDINGTKNAIFNVDGALRAVDDTCTHVGGPLSDGEIDGTVAPCPWHGTTLDLKTGAPFGPCAADGVRNHEVKTQGEDLLVKVP